MASPEGCWNLSSTLCVSASSKLQCSCNALVHRKTGLPTLLVADCPQGTKFSQPYHMSMCPWDLSFLMIFWCSSFWLFRMPRKLAELVFRVTNWGFTPRNPPVLAYWVPSKLPLLFVVLSAASDWWKIQAQNKSNDQSDNGNSGPWNKYATQQGTEHTQTARLYQTAWVSDFNWSIKLWRNFFSVSVLTKFVFFHCCPSEPHIWTRGVYAPQKEPARKASGKHHWSAGIRQFCKGYQLAARRRDACFLRLSASVPSDSAAAHNKAVSSGRVWESIAQSITYTSRYSYHFRPVDLCSNLLEFHLGHPATHPMSICGCTLANQIHPAESALQLHSFFPAKTIELA